MGSEFNLSDKIFDFYKGRYLLKLEDVKKFIKLVKEILKGDAHYDWTIQEIDKLAGKELK